jgi:uncharacterized protein (DUF2062 family)
MKIKKWIALWQEKEARLKESLRDSRIHRLLGERLFSHQIWQITRCDVANGISLGLFIGLTPTIPFHMFLSAIAAVMLRVNLFAAVAACWITNPLTAPPIYLAAHWVGRFLFGQSDILKVILTFFGFGEKMGKLVEHSLYLWTGALLFSATAAIVSNVGVRMTWDLFHRLKDKKHASGPS